MNDLVEVLSLFCPCCARSRETGIRDCKMLQTFKCVLQCKRRQAANRLAYGSKIEFRNIFHCKLTRDITVMTIGSDACGGSMEFGIARCDRCSPFPVPPATSCRAHTLSASSLPKRAAKAEVSQRLRDERAPAAACSRVIDFDKEAAAKVMDCNFSGTDVASQGCHRWLLVGLVLSASLPGI